MCVLCFCCWKRSPIGTEERFQTYHGNMKKIIYMSFAGSNNSQVLCSSVLIGSYSIADGWFLKPCFCYFVLVSGKLSKIHAERTLKNHGSNEVFVNSAKISKECQARGTFLVPCHKFLGI